MSERDKRQAQRKYAEYVVELYDSEGSLLVGVGRVMDLSATGVLIESGLRLVPGQVLKARLRRPDHSKLELSVTVVRVRGKGATLTYGLKFNRD